MVIPDGTIQLSLIGMWHVLEVGMTVSCCGHLLPKHNR